MRIISGSARGRRLREGVGDDIRPTSDKVKESIFNIIQFDIEGRRVLDLFAGTGQLGIEALSRGADSVTFVDSNPDAVRLIRNNLLMCGFSNSAVVHLRDAIRHIERDEPFDLIFIDPPYATMLAEKAITVINEFDKLNENGIIICELSSERAAPAVFPPYFLYKEYKYGGVKVVRYDRAAGGDGEVGL